jgi:alcohol dehydrogenase
MHFIELGQYHVYNYFDELILENGKIISNNIIAHRLPLSEASNPFDFIQKKKITLLKVV